MRRKIHRRRDADPQEGLEKYGKATFADPVAVSGLALLLAVGLAEG
jgi:hypothetical protein